MTNSADLASCESADIQRRILELIEGASSIAISGHTSPDGDALGSVLGLGLSLMKFFPNKDIALLLADDDPVPRIYRFMEGSDRLVGTAHQHRDPFRHGLRKPGKEVCLPQGHAAQHQQAQRAHGAVEHIGRAGPQMQQFPAQQSLPQADGACFSRMVCRAGRTLPGRHL